MLGKLLRVMVIPAAGALVMAGSGSAQAAGDLYGAIAVTVFRVGAATDYPTQYGADNAALDSCADPGCRIVARIHNECGVVLERDYRSPFGSGPMYFAGTGRSIAEAEQNARKLAGPDTVLPFYELTRPLFVLDALCTANAG
ncbi:DUF4189 domain-containing protein [Nocardia sp. NPDC050712]|uniref:DUF4189 domain-containing protein n=1 Tax=Nocardia sp. NPDC050712 TaxID=3155518 RepID=UPI0033E7F026